jgi:integrase
MQRRGADAPAWVSAVGDIEECLATYAAIGRVDRQHLLLASNSKPVKVASKRNGLHKFVKGWRDFMVKRSENRTYGEAIWLMAATGCRPQELVEGVRVRLNDSHVTVKIDGAKVGNQSGQPWRELDVSYRNMPISLRHKYEGDDIVVRITSTAGLRKSVASIGRALWPKLLGNVTPYHFRHALTEDLREAGWPAAEIGGALGHRVSDTSTYYGRRRRGGQGGVCEEPTILRGGVRTALPVRASAPFDPRLITGRKAPAP